MAHVAKHTWSKQDIVEYSDAAGQRYLILGGAIDVVEHPSRKVALCHTAQVVDVRRSFKLALDAVEVERTKLHRAAKVLEHVSNLVSWPVVPITNSVSGLCLELLAQTYRNCRSTHQKTAGPKPPLKRHYK